MVPSFYEVSLDVMQPCCFFIVEKWKEFFVEAGIDPSECETYADKFVENRMVVEVLQDLNHDILKEMEITLMGHRLLILSHSRKLCDTVSTHYNSETSSFFSFSTFPYDSHHFITDSTGST